MKRFLLLAFTCLFLAACEGDGYIKTDSQDLVFPFEGGTQSVTITSVSEYTVTTDAKWLSIETTGTGINVTAKRNIGSPDRTTSIVISAINGSTTTSLAVTQESDPNCVVYYTTIDSAPITLNSTDCFGNVGVTVISNIYENGIGAIKLTGPVTKIGKSAFEGCRLLESITIPETVISIEKQAFRDCEDLKSIVIPDNVIFIRESAFIDCLSLTSVTIGAKVTEIENYAFDNCQALESITIPDNVRGLGARAFGSCYNLQTAVIGNGVLEIKNNTFWDCTNLTDVTIGNSVMGIGESAFANCKLTSITIPEKVTWIGYHAFADCTNLKSVYCKPTTPPDVYGWMFDRAVSTHESAPIGCNIFVPSESVSAYKAKEGWKRYASYIKPYTF